MARTRSRLVAAGIVGLVLVGMTAMPASAVTIQPANGSGAAACPAPVAWYDVVPEHQAQQCASSRPDLAPGLDDGMGWLLWRGPDWGVPSLGTFV